MENYRKNVKAEANELDVNEDGKRKLPGRSKVPGDSISQTIKNRNVKDDRKDTRQSKFRECHFKPALLK